MTQPSYVIGYADGWDDAPIPAPPHRPGRARDIALGILVGLGIP